MGKIGRTRNKEECGLELYTYSHPFIDLVLLTVTELISLFTLAIFPLRPMIHLSPSLFSRIFFCLRKNIFLVLFSTGTTSYEDFICLCRCFATQNALCFIRFGKQNERIYENLISVCLISRGNNDARVTRVSIGDK